MKQIALSDLLEAGVHFGHQTNKWNPKMLPYIYAEKNGTHIINGIESAKLLAKACNFVKEASQKGKKFLFIGTKRQATNIVASEAEKCGAYFINQRWLGGTLTNWPIIKSRVEALKRLEKNSIGPSLDKVSKKEITAHKKNLEKLNKNLKGIKNMKQLPDLAIIIDQQKEITAVKECIKMKIPVICLLDTNCDPSLADIPIPANDDSAKSIKLILEKLSESIVEGKNSYAKK
ncbi:ribosomal protein S2 (plastid) [Cryptomonas paramecium]|uniref:Ribosomal protein S2 n=1 Tax=Cryptomonas paramaecium TaxID=2898 RepID=D2IS77_9CRYP|nr:ribosomal protein S2 [Cryptomonas paramecium]ACT46769.1 ribosomal protein S2 [Cryptomonas paramecium]BDA98026.1 ribosomal protein S2 [Cryptomonas paramecium]